MMEDEYNNVGSSGDCVSGVQLTWKKVNVGGNMPPRDGHCACSCGGKIFIFGGVVQTNGEGQYQESNDLLMFDPGKAIIASIMVLYKQKT